MQEKAGRDVLKAFCGCFMVLMLAVTLCFAFCDAGQAQTGASNLGPGQVLYSSGMGELRFADPHPKEQAKLVIKSIPIATTMPVGDGRQWDTGISVVNVSPEGTNVVINRMEFFDARGSNYNIGFGFNIVIGPQQRWSKMLSEVIGKGRDGVLQVHVITPPEGKWYLYESVFVDPTAFIVIEAKDVTSREMKQ